MTSMKIIFFFISLLLFSAEKIGNAGFLDNLTKFVDSVDDGDILTSDANNYHPDMNVSTQGIISGWIDIIGFKNSVIIDDIAYIRDDPINSTIVMYNSSHADVKGIGMSRVPNMDDRWSCYWCESDSLENNVTVYRQGNQIVARLTVTFKWHETVLNSGSNNRIDYIDTAYFYDYEPYPKTYPKASVIVNETKYFDANITLLAVNLSPEISRYYIKTRNGSVTVRKLIGQVMYSHKGLPVVKFTRLETVDTQGNDIFYLNNQTQIKGVDNYTTGFLTPFSTLEVSPKINTEIKKNQIYNSSLKNIIKIIAYSSIYVIGMIFVIKIVRGQGS